MNKKTRSLENAMFYISVAAMVLLIYSVSFVAFASMLQDVLFLIGGFVLFAAATVGKQRVIQALEIIVLVGIVLPLLKLQIFYSLGIVLFISLLMVVYLLKIEHYKKEPIGSIGSMGFVLMAIGFAFNTGPYPLITGLALASGAILAAIYAATAFYLYKVKLQVVIAILNAVFSINPIILVLHTVGI